MQPGFSDDRQPTPTMKPIELSAWQLAVAVSLILVSAAAISAALHLGWADGCCWRPCGTTVQLL